MNKLLNAALALVLALPAVACAASEPAQQEGTTTYKRTMTQAEAQKLIDDMNQAGPVCRRSASLCSYGSPDANGLVVFEAAVMCGGDACSLLQAETGCP
jgi:hypothetical protein